MQQNGMMRNGLAHSRTDDIVVALSGELQSTSEAVVQRLYCELYVVPWTVFWATCKPDSNGNLRGNFDGPPLILAQTKE
eukprot:3036616-Pyramimonas_sp.AAC.1